MPDKLDNSGGVVRKLAGGSFFCAVGLSLCAALFRWLSGDPRWAQKLGGHASTYTDILFWICAVCAGISLIISVVLLSSSFFAHDRPSQETTDTP